METEAARPGGVTALAYGIDRFLRDHIGRPYRWILAAGLAAGISASATSLVGAFGAHSFASLRTGAAAAATAVFQIALLINQLAQINEFRREMRERHAARHTRG